MGVLEVRSKKGRFEIPAIGQPVWTSKRSGNSSNSVAANCIHPWPQSGTTIKCFRYPFCRLVVSSAPQWEKVLVSLLKLDHPPSEILTGKRKVDVFAIPARQDLLLSRNLDGPCVWSRRYTSTSALFVLLSGQICSLNLDSLARLSRYGTALL
jgi:hypothetical protein